MMNRSIECLEDLVRELRTLPGETECVEFKVNTHKPQDIGEYVSALANSAALAGQPHAYVVWGISDRNHAVVGTRFRPRTEKVGNAELEIWLLQSLEPKINFRFFEVFIDGHTVVLLEIERARHQPVEFKGRRYIRVGSNKRKLKDFPEKERALWRVFDQGRSEGGEGIVQGRSLAEIKRAVQRRKRNPRAVLDFCPKCAEEAYIPVEQNYQADWKCLYCDHVGPAAAAALRHRVDKLGRPAGIAQEGYCAPHTIVCSLHREHQVT